MPSQEISDANAIEEISGILKDDEIPLHRVSIIVHKKGKMCYATYYLHPKGDHSDPPEPEGYEFHQTAEIFIHELKFMRIRVKEEADSRGLGHIRNLGF